MPGTKRRRYLEGNLGEPNVTLTPEELGEIDPGCPPDGAVVDRKAVAAIKAMNL